jgi:hypothetical protein
VYGRAGVFSLHWFHRTLVAISRRFLLFPPVPAPV